MSRIFDALQRSGTEQSGVEYPDMMSVATAIFEAPVTTEDDSKPPSAAKPEQVQNVPIPDPLPETSIPDSAPLVEGIGSLSSFPSLEVTVTAESRLVFFAQPESLAAEKFRFLGVRLR